ncbi:MAG TPA: HlyD family efflux transporter periplasmic adaptor subunit [Candidatus Acidoferrales bacterium]|nr:HlyD family efflux transporter periplasmic adaptor subunit [Candidatus Acidoferrales bacterium]
MDIQRPEVKRKKRIRRIIYIAIILILLPLVTYGLSRLKPAPPTVDGSVIWTDTVKRGEMLRQVQGLGTLVPETTRIIPAITEGRVEQRLMLAGTKVKADTVILVLSNPQLEQQYLGAKYQLISAEAQYNNLKATLENQLMALRSTAAGIRSQYHVAQMQSDADENMYKQNVGPKINYDKSLVAATELKAQNDLAQKQVDTFAASMQEQMAVQQATIDQDKAQEQLYAHQVDQLKVRPGIDGVLQELPVEVGQEVTPGTELAKVAQPSQLKAQLQIAETQARDIQLNQTASVDTHNGVIPGHVIRIDPAVVNGTRTVDVHLDGPLPEGAVPNLSVEGTVLIEKLTNVLYVGRPVHGDQNSTIGLFKEVEGGKEAVRANVEIGKTSVSTVQIIKGLNIGDTVILSDMSAYDAFERIRIN